LDSKMESMRAHFEREAESESSWTTYNSSLGRTLLNTAKFLKKEEPMVVPSNGNAPPVAKAASAAESAPAADSVLPVVEESI
jgi:hypothetical protein